MFFAICRLAIALSTLSTITGVAAVPAASRDILDRSKQVAAPAAPRFVIYSDQFVSGQTGPPDVSEVKGFNVFALSFWLTKGPLDKALEWTQLTADQRSTVKKQYKDAGVALIVSAFGETDTPTSNGADPTTTAQDLAKFVTDFDLDGIDVDYEDFDAMKSGTAEAWLTTFTKAARDALPQGDYILSHAPVAPWFVKDAYPNGAYLAVDKNVGDLIDYYNVQFYNQGTSEYTDCTGLLTKSGGEYPGSSLFEIAKNVDQNKIVVGKPAAATDADNGFIDPSVLATCLGQAKDQGWNAGAMVWEYPDAAAAWIKTVRSVAWPL